MLDKDFATKTLRRHRDYLWLLGGELIGRGHDADKLKKMPVDEAIAETIEEEGGPLIWPSGPRPSRTPSTPHAAIDWFEDLLQTEWRELKVYLTSVTEQWSLIAVAGPQTRALL